MTEAPVGILSNWYHSPSDLLWMTDAWHKSLYAAMYSQGFDLHLIVWANVPEVTMPTAYGPACGRAYPLSPTFLDDMRALAQTFAGSGTLYVTLFTEFQTYACKDNAWNPDPATNAYYRALKDQYLAALGIFHELAPNSRVSLGWGGWMVGWGDPATGAGRDMIQHFEDVMRASDFVSFQAMMNVPGGNAFDIRGMTRLLGAYGPVMLAHHMPDGDTCAVLKTDLQTLLTDAEMTALVNDGLFAWSFMNDNCLDRDPSLYDLTRAAIMRYAN